MGLSPNLSATLLTLVFKKEYYEKLHIRKLLKCGKARIVEYNPFTIQLVYESTNHTQDLMVAIDPGRTNIGVNVIDEENLCSVFNGKVTTRNKEIPKLMKERKMHRTLSRNGERKRRQRRAKANNTIFKAYEKGNCTKERYLPHYEKPIHIRYIKNSESKFCNRTRSKGWLTPTANQLLQTHINVIKKLQKYLPITSCSIELNKFAFMQMDNPNIKNWQYQQGKLFGKKGLHNAIDEIQENHCLLCKKGIDHYHHIVEQSNGGSDTIDNLAGLCEKHHTLVHKELIWKEKLLTKKQGLMKKYGALSVLNQIIPYLLKEITIMFGENNVFVCSEQDTFSLRNYLSIPKDHNYDAYCIGLMGILQKNNILLDNVIYNDNNHHNDIFDSITAKRYENVQIKHLQQFRRHNRAIIQAQRERTYKLDGEIVAKNRRKRIGQTYPSLHEWFIETKERIGLEETRYLQSQIQVTKSKRSYRNINALQPGALFLYKGQIYVLSGTLTNGTYLRAFGDTKTNFNRKDCIILKNNSGLVFIN